MPSSTAYVVTVGNSFGNACTIANGTGTFGSANVTNVTVTCVGVFLRFSVNGLTGGCVTVTANAGTDNMEGFICEQTPALQTGFRDLMLGESYSVNLNDDGGQCSVNGVATNDNFFATTSGTLATSDTVVTINCNGSSEWNPTTGTGFVTCAQQSTNLCTLGAQYWACTGTDTPDGDSYTGPCGAPFTDPNGSSGYCCEPLQ